MDEIMTEATLEVAPEEQLPEEIERHFATVGEVFDDGMSLIFDGEENATEKHYLCNTSVFFRAGDRVRIVEDSGTYIVEYVVGSPQKKEVVGLPSGGTAGQILRKMSDEEFHAAWQTLMGLVPSGGSRGQLLKKSSAENYDMEWGTPDSVSGTLPAGGSSGQFLVKSSATDYAAGWQTAYTVPNGGTTNQVLSKSSTTNGATTWRTISEIPSGGSAGQVLTKDSSTAGDVSWQTLSFSGGLPTGGSTGQLLQKTGTSNYDAGWVTGYLIPSGGSAGQVLTKDTSTAGDVSWKNPETPTQTNAVTNQYNSSSSYAIQFRTGGTYGTSASTFQIRMGTGSWYTLTTG